MGQYRVRHDGCINVIEIKIKTGQMWENELYADDFILIWQHAKLGGNYATRSVLSNLVASQIRLHAICTELEFH